MESKRSRTAGRHLTSRGKLKVTRQTLHDEIVDQIRKKIVLGEIPAGEKIRFNELAEDLQVSLTPLREALKVLAREHLVELLPNRGAIVAEITVENTRDLFEVLAGIEALAAELAASRITDEELRQLELLHERLRVSNDSGDKDTYFELNRLIHDMVVGAACNPDLEQIRSQLAVRAERARFISVGSVSHRKDSMREHETLLTALRNRDPKLAYEIWRQHLVATGEETCRVLGVIGHNTSS